MPAPGGLSEHAGSTPKALAFYLPQFHPIPENDEWWGKGFTEWANVTRARPLYPGHYQPHVPGELGYYDLRVPEVREAQAELARAHGIAGFVYYHYWFNGRRLLHRPFDEVLATGSPDFPFALCWANEEWTRNWDARSGQVLIAQEYSEEDDLAHIRWMLTAFADRRYITIDGRPLLLVYRPGVLPDANRLTDRWREEVRRAGFPDLYLCWVDGWGRPPGGPEASGFDATVGFMPFTGQRLFAPAVETRPHRILDYGSAVEARLAEAPPPWKHFPSVMVGWDNTPRYPRGATVFEGATPERYREWLERVVASVADVREEENYVFLLAWNEWAEGNHLEPDLRYGRAFLEATRSVLGGGAPVAGTPLAEPAPEEADLATDELSAHVAELVRGDRGDPRRPAVDLCAGARAGAHAKLHAAVPLVALDGTAESVHDLKLAGIDAAQCDIADLGALTRALDELGGVDTLLLVDTVHRLAEPHRLLAELSRWSLGHGGALLVLTAPNVAHFDVALRLLCGRWSHGGRGWQAGEPVHAFTEDALARLLSGCGWERLERSDCSSVASGADELVGSLPEELVGALRTLAEATNPSWSVEQFVWLLAPVRVDAPPGRVDDVVGPAAADTGVGDEPRRAVDRYLTSIGLVASETNRRAVAGRGRPAPTWRRALHRLARSMPRTASAWHEARRRLR